MVLTLSFFGFFVSRLLLAMPAPWVGGITMCICGRLWSVSGLKYQRRECPLIARF
jgi:hypothetical protein